MIKRVLTATLVIATVGGIFAPAATLPAIAPAPPTTRKAGSERVEQAIQKAREFLRGKQANGNWELVPKRDGSGIGAKAVNWGGLTAMTTYALLAAGEEQQDERIRQAVDFLKTADLDGTYATAFRCQVWAMLRPTPETQRLAQRDAELIMASMRREGEADGMFSYWVGKKKGEGYDHSNSQYAVLGLWACAQAGVRFAPADWMRLEKAWQSHQTPEGGWGYKYSVSASSPAGTNPAIAAPTATMTAAGVATLFITQDYLHQTVGLKCSGNLPNEPIERGLKWMSDNFALVMQTPAFKHYALYGVERIGVASGYKYFGAVDWYDQGADWLLSTQNPDGSWTSNAHSETDPVSCTCFGLLFLVRGRAPVMINKLSYDVQTEDGPVPGRWNQRPRDAANFVRWMGKAVERELHWQIVNTSTPLEVLHDSPILYIAGDQPIRFTEPQVRWLRTFAEEGGLVVANADCAEKEAVASLVELGQSMFPRYQFRELPRDHVIQTANYPASNWANPPSMLALGNGARELMIIFPDTDPGRTWQNGAPKGREELHQAMANICLYAVEKRNLRYKGQTHVVSRNSSEADIPLKLARINYDDKANWDPEPAGWRRLAVILANDNRINMTVDAVELGKGKLLAADYRLAHMTGTDAFQLPPEKRQELRKFLDDGGALIIDAAGGSTAFAESAEALLRELFPGTGPMVLPPNSPIYTEQKLPAVTYRPFARKRLPSIESPQVRAITIKDRPAVFYSREDLSVGLVGHTVDGIHGYEPKSAVAVISALILSRADKAPPKRSRWFDE